ncbi:MAG: transcriptional regulator [Pseudomonadales bacterium]|nr:transcriptional regulator [Pseudomonadales bacterium]
MQYQFEDFCLDTIKLELSQNGTQVLVEPQVFALLELLIAQSERVVTKDELLERIWGGRIVSEAAISSRIKTARAALGDDGKQQRLIKTHRQQGFRFVGEVTTTSPASVVPRDTQAQHQDTQDQRANPSVAILPLTLLSLDTRYEPLADAISHEVIADLSRLHWLKVISRASTFRLRGVNNVVSQAAEILHVDYVLTGTLALFDEQATVTVELIEAATGQAIWAERYVNELSDLLALRGQIATHIANAIEQRIQVEEAKLTEQFATEDLSAWMSYFRGLRHANRFNAHDNEIATHLFEQAVKLDSQFALAHAGLSFTQFQNAFVGYSSDVHEAQSLSLKYAERAFELDQLDPIASLMMGRAKLLNGQAEQASPWFERCAQISPNNALAYYNQSLMSVISGDVSETTDLSMRALSLSPIDPLQYGFLATRALGHISRGEYEAAADWGVQAANAPRAHHLIDAIAAITTHSAGDLESAMSWSNSLKQRAPHFRTAHFFRSFPVAAPLQTKFKETLTELGFS